MAIAISPTSRCNLACNGCYSRLHPRDDEMAPEVVERIVHDAFQRGVFMFVITGGEPYLVPEMLGIYERARGALFLTVTNGTLIDEATARRIARAGNVLPVVSLEGGCEDTDSRRGSGVHERVRECMRLLRGHGVLFGFSIVLTGANIGILDDDSFLREMREAGCVIGFFNDFVPVTAEEQAEVPSREELGRFREGLRRAREREPIVLLHLPEDEYDRDGRCIAVDRGGMHINSQGFVEPCPFAHFALENAKDRSFEELLRSPFLAAIRNHPTALQRGEIGCSLAANCQVLEEIARSTGARHTRDRSTS